MPRSTAARAARSLIPALVLAGCTGGADPRLDPAAGAVPGGPDRPDPPRPAAPAHDLASDADLAACRAWAEAQHPGLAAARQRARAAAERVPQARTPPDPRVEFGWFLEPAPRDMDRTRARAGVMQTLPWPGKRPARARVAAAEAEAVRQALEARRREVREEVDAAWHEWVYLERATALGRDTVTLVANLERIARARYRTGGDAHPDVLRAQVELGRLESEVRSLEAARPAALARLNAALGRPTGASLARAAETVPADPPPAAASDLALAGLDAATALAASPDLAVARAEAAAAEADVERARREVLPDPTLGLEGMDMVGVESDQDPLALTFGLDLPVWDGRYGAQRREARARARAARAALAEASRRLEAEWEAARFAHYDAQRRADLFSGTLVPKAREALGSALRAYEAGGATFSDGIDAQRSLLELERARERAVADQAIARAHLERLMGRDLP